MDKIMELIRSVLGAAGWLLLGLLLKHLDIGPWWVWLCMLAGSGCRIGWAVDKALEPKGRWRV